MNEAAVNVSGGGRAEKGVKEKTTTPECARCGGGGFTQVTRAALQQTYLKAPRRAAPHRTRLASALNCIEPDRNTDKYNRQLHYSTLLHNQLVVVVVQCSRTQ